MLFFVYFLTKPDFICCRWEMAGNQFAGFQVAWKGNGTAASFTLSTVHGAGHEVPTYKGQQAKQLFGRFLARV